MRRTTAVLSAALLLLSLAAARPSARAELEQVLEAFRAGELPRAIALAEDVAPEDADARRKARYVAGEAQLALGRDADAAASFRAVLAERADAGPALVGLARALVRLGELEEAEASARRALELDDDDAAARCALGEVLLALGETKPAERELERAERAAPGDPAVARAVVRFHVLQGDGKAAERSAQRFARARPEHPLGPFLQGLALEVRGKDRDAIEAYRAALALDERFLDAHKNLAILCHTRNPTYQDEERTRLALEHYARYFELGGHDPELERIYRSLEAFLSKLREGEGR